MRWLAGVLATALVVCLPRPAAAQWQFKPFVGATYSGSTTFLIANLDQAAEHPHFAFGGSASYLGEIFGLETEYLAQIRGASAEGKVGVFRCLIQVGDEECGASAVGRADERLELPLRGGRPRQAHDEGGGEDAGEPSHLFHDQ